MREQVTALEARNKELEEYAHMVAHDLKEPLTVLIMTADLIKDVPDLTSEEWREYLLQIKSTAYEMKGIINNLLLFAEVSKAEAPRDAVHMDQVRGERPGPVELHDQGTAGSAHPPAGLAGCHRLRTLDRRGMGQLP